MKTHNYTDTGLTFTVKPYSTHHIWEYGNYLYYVDETQTDLYKKHVTTGIETKVADLVAKGQSGWLDNDNLHLVLCDNPGNSFHHYYYELDNNDNEIDVGESSGADAGTVYTYDIVTYGSDHYVFGKIAVSGEHHK